MEKLTDKLIMKERLTCEKEAKEMNMLELSQNCMYIKEGWCRYRDYDIDESLVDFIVEISNKLGGNIVTADSGDDEAISEELWDNLNYGYDNIDGIIALLYTRLAALANLRKKLSAYEDLELTPEQIREMDRAYSEQAKELGKYKAAEERLNGISIIKLADAYISIMEKETGEKYSRGRLLTNEDADKWDKYKAAEKKGLLLRLPCKRGDMVYAKMKSGEYEKAEVRDYIHFSPYGFCIIVVSEKYEKRTIPFSEFGKTVFLTKEEAKAAL